MSIRFFPGVFCSVALFGLAPFSAAYAANTCEWARGGPKISYVANVGQVYVPRDAKIGEAIGQSNRAFAASAGGSIIECETDGARLTFEAKAAVTPFLGPVPMKPGMDSNGLLLQTNIDGVGVRIKFGQPYDGMTTGFWKLSGSDSSVPFSAYIDFFTPFRLQHSILRGETTLVKTGPIDRGIQQFDSGKALVAGSFTGIPDAFSVALSGSVTQAECALSANPVSADPINLGEWNTSQFTGEGYTTDPVPFSITLNSCVSDPHPRGGITNAYIRLEPTAGSVTLNAARGLFSLGDNSTAKGVGIQILGRDANSPVELLREISQGAIPQTGGMQLDFNARFYQTGRTTDIEPGAANAALSFTITYK